MIDKITPANISKIDNRTKSGGIADSAGVKEASTEEISSQPQKTTSKKFGSTYGTAYLQARDTQANISYMQARNDALQNISGKLQQLKSAAIRYESAKDASLAEQDVIVGDAEQALYSIDKLAGSAKFLGTPVIGDADSTSLGLEVVNFESGGAMVQIDAAIKKVAAMIAGNNTSNVQADVRIDNLRKLSGTQIADEYIALKAAESFANATETVSAEQIYSALNGDKVSELLGI